MGKYLTYFEGEIQTMGHKKLELLAPAQNKSCAICAIEYGADSVYMGANLFGARKNAGNSLSDIEEVINYAHKFGVKVYITINTILDDKELLEAQKLIYELHKLKADGIIFQDMGLLSLKLPDIKLIASTQCDIRTTKKVKFFENLGIKRVILARELSLEKIKEICASTNVEIETFIHGALCVSYSGQCYLSYKIGGRSANRGDCAQACRKKYTLVDEKGKVLAKDKYLLSLKDFMAANYLERLAKAGVTSFKIEGRLKDENYIKTTVGFYRRLLDDIIAKNPEFERASAGCSTFDFTPDVLKSFNRGFCEYFLSGKRSDSKGLSKEIYNFDIPNAAGEQIGEVKEVRKDCFTLSFTRKNGEIHAQDGLCYFKNGGLKGFLVNKVEKHADKKGKEGEAGRHTAIYPNDFKVLSEIKPGVTIYRNKDSEYENILKNSQTKRRLRGNFKVFEGYIEFIDETKSSVKIEFNTDEEAKNPVKMWETWANALKKCGGSDFYIENVEFLSDKIYFLPVAEINKLRRTAFEKIIQQKLENYRPARQEPVKPAKYPLTEGDYRLNVHNKESEKFYNKCGCEVKEYSFESRKGTPQEANKGEIKELMRTKHCLRHAFNVCLKNSKENSGKLFLIDEKGAKYALHFDCANCEMVILG